MGESLIIAIIIPQKTVFFFQRIFPHSPKTMGLGSYAGDV
jgi:hypothetical protein